MKKEEMEQKIDKALDKLGTVIEFEKNFEVCKLIGKLKYGDHYNFVNTIRTVERFDEFRNECGPIIIEECSFIDSIGITERETGVKFTEEQKEELLKLNKKYQEYKEELRK